MEKDYEDFTIEELEAELLTISNRRDGLRAEALAISAVRDRKVVLEKARQKVAKMSPAERDALAQVING